MVIDVNVQYNDRLLPDIILLTLSDCIEAPCYGCSKEEISPHSRFSSIQLNGYIFENKKCISGTMSVPIGSLYTATKTPARGARGQGLKGRFLNSTERRPSRCVRVEVHGTADRLKLLRLGMPCVARIRRVSHEP